uniref:Secreted protein n=1 Tax=Macrostomum lignano TaxID=282301 RepID=A0A1I8HV53_9PLAT
MQLSKVRLLFMLVACSAIQTLGAPVVRPKCELGEYPDALVDCLDPAPAWREIRKTI